MSNLVAKAQHSEACGQSWAATPDAPSASIFGCTMSPARVRWASCLLVGLIAFATFFTRWYRIGAESLWLDEATSIFLARMPIDRLIGWTAADIHPPLYYILLHFFLRLGDSETVVRGLSALVGCLTVPVLYGLGRVLFHRTVGLISALLLVLSPLHLWYSQEARMYALVTFLGACSVYCLLLALRSNAWHLWLGYILSTTMALYTHYYAIFLVLFQSLFMIYLFCAQRSRRRQVVAWIMAQVLVLVCFSPWMPILVRQASSVEGGWVANAIGRPGLEVLPHTMIAYTVGMVRRWVPPLLRRTTYVLFGISASIALLGGRKKGVTDSGLTEGQATGFAVAYLALPLGVAWLLSQWKPVYSLRYVLPFLLPFLLLVARGVCLTRVLSGGFGAVKWLWVPLLAGLLGLSGFGVYLNAMKVQNPDWRGIVSHVVENAGEGDIVLFSPGWNVKPFEYYARGQVDVYGQMPVPVPERGLDDVLRGPLADHTRAWLIWQPGHYSDPEGRAQSHMDARYGRLDAHEYQGIGRLLLYDLNP